MAFSLSAKAQADSYRLESYEIVASTNDLAAEFAKSGDAGRLWLTAEQQSGGRGRRSRVWHSPPGNLYASLLLAEDLTAEQTAALGFVAGVSLYEAVKALLPPDLWQDHNFKLKWPNDMLADGAKLAGILPEYVQFPVAAAKISAGAKARHGGGALPRRPAVRAAAIIGIGVNVNAAPAIVPPRPAPAENTAPAENAPAVYPITSLRQLGAECSPPQLFTALSEAWAGNYALWAKGAGMAAIREKWLHYVAYRGESIHLIYQGRRLDGIFETIDAKGRLVLREAKGELYFISAGEVYFGAAASAEAGR